MNEKTKCIFYLCRIHDYALQVNDTVKEYNNDIDAIFNNRMITHGLNMCLLQMGEFAARIRDLDESLYLSEIYELKSIKGLRDRIAHSYGSLDYNLLKETLMHSIAETIEKIENDIPLDLLNNPYQLHEMEYDEYIKITEMKSKIKNDIDSMIKGTYNPNKSNNDEGYTK